MCHLAVEKNGLGFQVRPFSSCVRLADDRCLMLPMIPSRYTESILLNS
jgi:hypothetical protein